MSLTKSNDAFTHVHFFIQDIYVYDVILDSAVKFVQLIRSILARLL